MIFALLFFFPQVIQTFSAKDQDLPSAGQQFSFKATREDLKHNKNFTIRDFGSKCPSALTTAAFGATVNHSTV